MTLRDQAIYWALEHPSVAAVLCAMVAAYVGVEVGAALGKGEP
jgi:hypothetical protein